VAARLEPERQSRDGEKDLFEICFSLRLVLTLEGVEFLYEMMDDWSSEETDDPVHEPRKRRKRLEEFNHNHLTTWHRWIFPQRSHSWLG